VTIRSLSTKWVFLVALLLVVMACSSTATATKNPAAIPTASPTEAPSSATPEATPPSEPTALPTRTPTSTPRPSPSPTPTGPLATLKDALFNLELAVSSPEKAKGLGFRDSLPEDTGMLFVYTSESNRAFWMKGMEFSIDIIWLSKDGTILDISKEAAPQPGVADSDLKLYRPRDPAQYVLEVNAGLSDRYGFQRDDHFAFHGMPPSIPLGAGP